MEFIIFRGYSENGGTRDVAISTDALEETYEDEFDDIGENGRKKEPTDFIDFPFTHRVEEVGRIEITGDVQFLYGHIALE